MVSREENKPRHSFYQFNQLAMLIEELWAAIYRLIVAGPIKSSERANALLV